MLCKLFKLSWSVTIALVIVTCNIVFSQVPYTLLSRPSDKEITISLLATKTANYTIKYGTSNGVYPLKTIPYVGQINVPTRIVLKDLMPNTRYFYIVEYQYANQGLTASPEYSFQTQRSIGESFCFTIEADEHLYDKKGIKKLYEITLENQSLDNPDFMFSLGDMFGDDHTPNETTDAEMKQLHLDYMPFLTKITHSIPFYFCLGNHEGENGYYLMQNNGANIATYGTNWRKYYYPNPIPNDFYTGNEVAEDVIGLPENYYAFVWGDVHIIVLDVYRHCDINDKPKNWDWTLGKTQYDWFKNTLETSKSKFKVVMAHHTRGQGRGGIKTARAFEWGGYNGDNGTNYQFDLQRPGWGDPIHQLMVKNGVNIYFQGHDHVYAKEELDGIIYQTIPMPSDSTYSLGITANGDAFEGRVLDGSGHIKVSVHQQCLQVDFERAFLPNDTITGQHKNREIADSYTIGNCSVGTTNEYQHQINLFPNPANDAINISLPENSSSGKIDIYDITGRMWYEYNISSSQNQIKVDVSQFNNGLYFIKYQAQNATQLVKWIKN